MKSGLRKGGRQDRLKELSRKQETWNMSLLAGSETIKTRLSLVPIAKIWVTCVAAAAPSTSIWLSRFWLNDARDRLVAFCTLPRPEGALMASVTGS